MNIDGIREAFSKAMVAFTENGIVVSYTFKDDWLEESFFDEKREVFLSLLEQSDVLVVEYVHDKAIRLVFRNNLNGQEIIIYPPISKEVTFAELEELFSSEECVRREIELCDLFRDVDLTNKSDVVGKMKEIADSFESKDASVISMPAISRWKRIRSLAIEFANSLHMDYDVFAPGDDDFDGSITIFFPMNVRNKVVIEGKVKSCVEDTVRHSSGIDIECNIVEGFFNITFYV